MGFRVSGLAHVKRQRDCNIGHPLLITAVRYGRAQRRGSQVMRKVWQQRDVRLCIFSPVVSAINEECTWALRIIATFNISTPPLTQLQTNSYRQQRKTCVFACKTIRTAWRGILTASIIRFKLFQGLVFLQAHVSNLQSKVL